MATTYSQQRGVGVGVGAGAGGRLFFREHATWPVVAAQRLMPIDY